MAIVLLTDERRFKIEDNERFRENVEIAIFNLAQYWVDNDGTGFAGNAASLLRWAKMRWWSHNRVIANPINIDFSVYLKQFISELKNHPVYNDAVPYNEDNVITDMIAANKFAAIIEQVFEIKILDVEMG